MCDFVKSLVPRDTFKAAGGAAGAPAVLPAGKLSPSLLPFASDTTPGPANTRDPRYLGDFGAQESASNGMLGIALNLGGAAVFDGNQDAAGVRASRAGRRRDDVLHPRIIKDSVETGLAPSVADAGVTLVATRAGCPLEWRRLKDRRCHPPSRTARSATSSASDRHCALFELLQTGLRLEHPETRRCSTSFDDTTGEVSGTWVLGRPPGGKPGLLFYHHGRQRGCNH